MWLSVIIPTLNEEEALPKTVECVRLQADDPAGLEIIVVDAGSRDRTAVLARSLQVPIYINPELKGLKYASLNFGVAQSQGDVVLFLDADTYLPKGFDTFIRHEMTYPKCVGGAFEFRFSSHNFLLWLIEQINRIRYRVDRRYFGDQAIFCRKSVFQSVGGYPDQPIMEAAFLCELLSRQGRLHLIQRSIYTSPRRFLAGGIMPVFLLDFRIWLCYWLRLDIRRFAKHYWSMNDAVQRKG